MLNEQPSPYQNATQLDVALSKHVGPITVQDFRVIVLDGGRGMLPVEVKRAVGHQPREVWEWVAEPHTGRSEVSPPVALQVMARLVALAVTRRLRDPLTYREHPRLLRPLSPLPERAPGVLRSFDLFSYALFVFTGLTTAFGSMQVVGAALEGLELGMRPGLSLATRFLVSGLLAVGSSFIIYRAKGRFSQTRYEEGRGVPSAIGAFFGLNNGLRISKFGWALFVLFLVFGDMYTNFTGMSSLLTSREDLKQQMKPLNDEIDRRIKSFSKKLEHFPAERAESSRDEVERILLKESGGQSYSGLSGKGPLYCAKAALLKEDALCWRRLRTGRGALWRALASRLEQEPLARNRETLSEELRAIGEQEKKRTEAVISKINVAQRMLSDSKSMEGLQYSIDAIVGGGQDGSLFLELEDRWREMQGALDRRSAKYNLVMHDIAEIADRVGGYQVDPSSIEAMKSEPIEIDGSRIKVKRLVFREGFALVPLAFKLYGPSLGALVIFLAASLSVLGSYGDLVFAYYFALFDLYWADRVAAADIESLLQERREKMVEVITESLSRGPMSKVLWPVELPEAVIHEAFVAQEGLIRQAVEANQRQGVSRLRTQTATAAGANRALLAMSRVVEPPEVLRMIVWIVERLTGRLIGGSGVASVYHLIKRSSVALDRQSLYSLMHEAVEQHHTRDAKEQLLQLEHAIEALDESTAPSAEVFRIKQALDDHRERLPGEVRQLDRRLDNALRHLPSALKAEMEQSQAEVQRQALMTLSERLGLIQPRDPSDGGDLLVCREAFDAAQGELDLITHRMSALGLNAPHPDLLNLRDRVLCDMSDLKQRLDGISGSLQALERSEHERRVRQEHERSEALREAVSRWSQVRDALEADDRVHAVRSLLETTKMSGAPLGEGDHGRLAAALMAIDEWLRQEFTADHSKHLYDLMFADAFGVSR